MTSLRFPLFAAAVIALMMTASSVSLAQSAGTQQEAPQLTEQQLKTYAMAALQVQQINQTYQPAINQAESSEDQKALFDKATQEMAEAIRNNGLSVEQYNQITAVVQADPDLSKQVQGYMADAQ